VLSSESEEEAVVPKKEGKRGRRPVTGGTKERDQPKRSVKGKRTLNYADEEEDDFNLTQNAGNSRKEMVSQGVVFLLIGHTKMTPVKRADFTKHVLKGANVKPAHYRKILEKVQKLLKNVRNDVSSISSFRSPTLCFMIR